LLHRGHSYCVAGDKTKVWRDVANILVGHMKSIVNSNKSLSLAANV